MSDEREKEVLQYILNNIPFIVQEAFLGYKYRKRNNKLDYTDSLLPTKLIQMYYSLNPGEVEFNNLRKSFINKYVKNESKLEDVHREEEIEGLLDMYEYLHSDEMEEYFSVYSLKELHKKLFCHTEHPECAGEYRTDNVYLPGTGIGLADWYMIPRELYCVSSWIDELHEKAKLIKECGEVDQILDFLDECVELKCELIRIHPFLDGNGRTVRAFINKLLEDAGLPSVYIKASERQIYQAAMQKALGDGEKNDSVVEKDKSLIKTFYRYKVCDSIIELDINERMKKQKIVTEEIGKSKQKQYTYYYKK